MDKSPDTSKYFHFRVNDLSQEQYDHLTQVDCKYMKIGAIEQNKIRTGGHYHTILVFERSVRVSYAKRLCLYNKKLSKADWYCQPKYTATTVENFIKYAIKEGIRFTKGTYIPCGRGAITDKVQANTESTEIQEANTGEDKAAQKAAYMQLRLQKAQMLDVDWFMKHDLNYFLTSQCKALFANCQHRTNLTNLTELDNYYIYGDPGTGKSSAVEHVYPGCYRKIKTNEKWDSYSNYLPAHETVYFDELDTIDMYERCMGGLEEFKTMTDVYPFPTRANYGSTQVNVRPKRFIITSNFTPPQVFATENRFGKKIQHLEMILKAFKRRFKVMHISEFQKLKGIEFDRTIMRTVDIEEPPLTPVIDYQYNAATVTAVLAKLKIDLDEDIETAETQRVETQKKKRKTTRTVKRIVLN